MLKTARKLRRGFTLTELLVVIAVIIIVAGMAVASMVPFLKGRALSSGVRRVEAVVWRARSVAATRRTNATIAFRINPATGTQEMAVFATPQVAWQYVDPNQTDPEPISQPQQLPQNVQFVTRQVNKNGVTVNCPVLVPVRDGNGYIQLPLNIVDPPEPKARLVFHPSGSLHPVEMGGTSGNWAVVLEDQNGQRKAVTITFATGLTRTTDL